MNIVLQFGDNQIIGRRLWQVWLILDMISHLRLFSCMEALLVDLSKHAILAIGHGSHAHATRGPTFQIFRVACEGRPPFVIGITIVAKLSQLMKQWSDSFSCWSFSPFISKSCSTTFCPCSLAYLGKRQDVEVFLGQRSAAREGVA